MVSLASAIASASSSNGMHARRSGRRSPRARRATPGSTGAEDRRREPVAGPVGRATRGSRPARRRRRKEATASRCAGGDQRAHLGRLVERVADADAPARRAPAAPGTRRPRRAATRIRERAQQSWPALPNTATGAAAAAASRSASAKTTLADLPPSSSVTRLIVCGGAARRSTRPTSVEPVKAILATSGCSTSRCPHGAARAGDDVDDALGQPGLERELGEAQRGQRRQLGGLEHDRVARRQRRRELPRRRSLSGKFHGVISADDAERLADRERRRRRRRGSCRRAAARARPRSSGRCRPPCRSRRARRRSACRRCAPRAAASSSWCVAPARSARPVQQPRAVGRGDARARPGSAALRARDRRVGLLGARARRPSASTCLGRGLEDVERRAHGALAQSRHASGRSRPPGVGAAGASGRLGRSGAAAALADLRVDLGDRVPRSGEPVLAR